MLKFQSREREYLLNIHAIAKDQNDNLIFVGMTIDESVWYSQYLEQSFNGIANRGSDDEIRYLSLHDKNEAARRAILASESLMQSHLFIEEQ